MRSDRLGPAALETFWISLRGLPFPIRTLQEFLRHHSRPDQSPGVLPNNLEEIAVPRDGVDYQQIGRVFLGEKKLHGWGTFLPVRSPERSARRRRAFHFAVADASGSRFAMDSEEIIAGRVKIGQQIETKSTIPANSKNREEAPCQGQKYTRLGLAAWSIPRPGPLVVQRKRGIHTPRSTLVKVASAHEARPERAVNSSGKFTSRFLSRRTHRIG